MLTDAELASARADLEATLTDTAQIVRLDYAPDGRGGRTQAEVVLTTVPCRLAPAQAPQEREVAGRLGVSTLWYLYLPAGTDAPATRRITVGARTLEVVAQLGPRSCELLRQVLCREIA